jgi:hypothetical protein
MEEQGISAGEFPEPAGASGIDVPAEGGLDHAVCGGH